MVGVDVSCADIVPLFLISVSMAPPGRDPGQLLLQLARVVLFGESDTDDVKVVSDNEFPVETRGTSLPNAVWSISRNQM